MDKESLQPSASIEERLRRAGVPLKALHTPRRDVPLVRILIRAVKASELEIASTVASLLGSGCQDFAAEILVEDAVSPLLAEWLATDHRFAFIRADRSQVVDASYTAVFMAGTALGLHSLEAMIESLTQANAMVLRALVDGQRGAVELWETGTLRELSKFGDPEKSAREAGGERWVSGAALGLHNYLLPTPKLHLRKGAAASLDLNVVVRDLSHPATRTDYERKIRQLEYRLRKSEMERRRLEQGLVPQRGLSRARAIASKGPAYVLQRLKARAGRTGV